MSWFDAARARVRLLVSRRADEARMDEEMRFHIEMETARLIREEGLDQAEARRRAFVLFGGVQQYREELRDGRGLARLTGLSLDLKLGVRMLRKHPGLTAVGVLALTVAIGAGAAYLEVLNDVFHSTLPIDGGARIVRLSNWDVAKRRSDPRALYDFTVWRHALTSVEELGAFLPLQRNLITEDGRAQPVEGTEISTSAFRLVRVAPLLGRPLVAADESPGAPAVVVIGERLWQTRFGGDPRIVGRTVRLGKVTHTIVGVMPASFGFPVNHRLWVPLRLGASVPERRAGPTVGIFGRLAPGVTVERAQAELSAIGRQTSADFPTTHATLRPQVKPYLEALFTDPDAQLGRLVSYAVNLFFIALLAVCGGNVATLVFARTATRAGELTVRTALGASRGRIVAQLFAEALVLTTLSAVVGLGFVAIGLRLGRRVIENLGAQESAPFWWNDSLSPATILYAIVLALLAAVLIGVVPALKATGSRVEAGLKQAAAGGAGMQFGGLWTKIVVMQVALTTIFLLIVVSFGWNARGGRFTPPQPALAGQEYLTFLLDMEDDTVGASFAPGHTELRTRFQATYEEIARRFSAQQGVASVTYATRIPGMAAAWMSVEVEGAKATDDAQYVRRVGVAPNYFQSLGAPLVAGRSFSADDIAPGRNAVIVDQTFVQDVLGSRGAIGTHIRWKPEPGKQPDAWYEIVGVVRNLAMTANDAGADPMVYIPASPATAYPIWPVVHVRGDARAAMAKVRGIVAAADPTLRVSNVMLLSDFAKPFERVMRYVDVGLAVAGTLALLLSTAGIYSLTAFTVARRTREIGIRVALGADARRVITGIFAQASRQIGIGVLIGSIPGTAVVLWGVPEGMEGAGPLMAAGAFASVGLFMIGVGALASMVPARRALAIQPTDALRTE